MRRLLSVATGRVVNNVTGFSKGVHRAWRDAAYSEALAPVMPPSTGMTAPVTKLAAFEAR